MKKLLVIMAGLISAFTVPAAGKPQWQLHVRCGDIEIFLAPHLFWNLNGITCKKLPLGRQDHGFYGTVIRYDVGWVGTGHLENGIGETGIKVEFTRDGEKFTPSPEIATVDCRSFTMIKRARLHQAELVYTLSLAGGVLRESARLNFLKTQPLKIIYNFMHPWHNSFENYRMLSADGKISSGTTAHRDKGKMLLFERPQIATLYSKEWNMAIFSTITAQAAAPLGHWLFWNRGEQDRKLYFRPLFEKNVAAGTSWEWQISTSFRNMSQENWQKLDLEKFQHPQDGK